MRSVGKAATVRYPLLLHFLRHFFREQTGIPLFTRFQLAAFRHFRFQTFGGFAAAFCFAGRREEGYKQQDKQGCDTIVFHVKFVWTR